MSHFRQWNRCQISNHVLIELNWIELNWTRVSEWTVQSKSLLRSLITNIIGGVTLSLFIIHFTLKNQINFLHHLLIKPLGKKSCPWHIITFNVNILLRNTCTLMVTMTTTHSYPIPLDSNTLNHHLPDPFEPNLQWSLIMQYNSTSKEIL